MRHHNRNESGHPRSAARFGWGVVALALLAGDGPALAAEPDWPEGTYRYIVVNQSVRDALMEFGHNIGVPVETSGKVSGRMSGSIPRGTAREFLDWICSRHGLVWYFDGSAIHVSNLAESRTEVVQLGENALSDLGKRLDSLDILDPRFPVKISREERAASISGPPAYIALVQQTIDTLVQPETRPVVPTTVRVFRGRQAEAVTLENQTRQAQER